MMTTYVSSQKDCYFCQTIHAALAAHYLGGDEHLVKEMKLSFESAAISGKLKALLAIASKVQQAGKQVTMREVAGARQQGATGKEIRDTVLIAAGVCMHNRYVDGLATWTPDDPNLYRANGKRLAEGYLESIARSSAAQKKYA